MAVRPWPDDMNSTLPPSSSAAPIAASAAPVPRPGSSLYHALRSAPPALRPALQLWLQWWHEVSRIPLEVSDAGVAESKLQWWAQEVRDSLAGQPHHPLMQARAALSALPEPSAWPEITLWAQQLEGLIQLVHQTRWLDDATLQRHNRMSTGAALEGAACILGASSASARSAACLLGMGLRQSHQVARLGLDARLGWVNVSIDVLQTHDVKAHQLSKPDANQAPAGWPGLLQHLIEQARASIEQGLSAIQALPDAEVRALLPLRVVAHIHLTQLQEIAGKGDRILHERVLLTPLRKWWISQRVRWGWLP